MGLESNCADVTLPLVSKTRSCPVLGFRGLGDLLTSDCRRGFGGGCGDTAVIVVEMATRQSGGAPPIGAVGDGNLWRAGFREQWRVVRGVARQREPPVTGSGSEREAVTAEVCKRKRSK